MDSILQDFRFAIRSFARSPGLTVALVSILALGIGGTTAMFSVVYGVLLKPLPLHEPEELVLFSGSVTARPGERDRIAYWSQARSLDSVAEIGDVGGVNLGAPGSTLYVPAVEVSANFFSVLDESPQLGRGFLPSEERPGENNVVVLAHGLWQRAFGGDPRIIGQDLRINGETFRAVGVLKPGFAFPDGIELWIPRATEAAVSRVGKPEHGKAVGETYGQRLIGRLKEGVTLEKAQSEIRALAVAMDGLQKDAGMGTGALARLIPLDRWAGDRFRAAVMSLFAGAGFVLLIAAANAANLLLARAATRQKEVAVRMCLGANRWRIVWQRLTEGVWLATGGCMVGVLISYLLVHFVRSAGPSHLLGLQQVEVNSAMLTFAAALSAVTGILVSLAPAAQAAAPDLTTALKQGGLRAAGSLVRRVQQALVVSEVALACALLIGALVMIRSFQQLSALDSGFDPAQVLAFSVSLPAATHSGSAHQPEEAAGASDWRDVPDLTKQRGDAAAVQRSEFQRRLLEEIKSLPGVTHTGIIARLPVADSFGMVWVGPSNEQGTLATIHNVNGDYLQAMGIPLLAGRYFDQNDSRRGGSVVVSQSLAYKLWPGENPVGKQLELSWKQKHFREIVGVVADTAVDRLDDYDRARVQFYVPDPSVRGFSVVVRMNGQADHFERTAKSMVQTLNRDVTAFRMRKLDDVIGESVRPQRFRGQLLTAFAGVAVVLALFGVAAVMAYSVATRTHEMGVRLALGASRQDVLRMVLREGARLSLAGVALGLLGAWWLSRYVASMLYGVSATDPWSYSVAATVLVAGALLGSLLPALRASRVDPAIALRYE